MSKRIFALIACTFIVAACALSVSAAGYLEDDFSNDYEVNYSIVPFQYMWIVDHFGQRYMVEPFANLFYFSKTGGTIAEECRTVTGWVDDGGVEPVPEILEYVHTMAEVHDINSVRVVNNHFTITSDSRLLTSGGFTLRAADFWIRAEHWDEFARHFAINQDKPAGNYRSDLTVFYAVFDKQGNATESVSNYKSSATKSTLTLHPIRSASELFDPSSLVDGYIYISSLSIQVYFDGFYRGGFSLDVPYLHPSEVDYVPHLFRIADTQIVEKEVIKEVIKVVPAEELDLFSWLVAPIETFFGLEVYPGISIGGIGALILVVLVVGAVLVLFKK